jgi:hypothetical protein
VALLALAVCLPVLAQNPGAVHIQAPNAPARLVQLVREATAPFQNINAAILAGYGPLLGCVNGPDHGAMGVHHVNLALYAGVQIDAGRPEALTYGVSNVRLHLVSTGYIVDAEAWLANHLEPLVLEGQTFNFAGSPNRFKLPEFYELHVWARKDNSEGAFAGWNNHVSCEGQ